MGNVAMTKLLLERGANSDLRVKNKIQYTPIEYTLPNTDIRSFLLQYDPALRELLVDEEDPLAKQEAAQAEEEHKQHS